jgi:hypothetical protein
MLQDRLLVISAERLTFATCPNGKVLVKLDWRSEKLGFRQVFISHWNSAEARSATRALLRKADEA